MNAPLRATRPGRVGAGAFTLVEMLVSMAVLVLLVVFIGQIISMTGRAITANNSELDAAGQARLFFDRLGADLAARPRRADLGMVFTKAVGNDTLQFYSQVNGYNGLRHVASVGYRILSVLPATAASPTPALFELQRGATGTDWTAGSTSNALLFSPQPPPTSGDADYEVLADGIFRLEYCYLLNTGARSNTANADFSNVTAVIVVVAVLPASAHPVATSDQRRQLSAALPDNTDGSDPLQQWSAAMAATGFAPGLPPAVVHGVRLSERTFYVP